MTISKPKPLNKKQPPVRKPLPKPDKPLIANDANKVAFIGRSNVGKSSLINYLLEKTVVKVSKTPGKTRFQNLIKFTNTINFVDMPGYSYARISKEVRKKWETDLVKLFFEDRNLVHIFVLIDISIKPLQVDQDFVRWLKDEVTLNHSLIYTKIDKLSQKEKFQNQRQWSDFLKDLDYNFELKTFEVSAFKKKGGPKIKLFIDTLKEKRPNKLD